MKKIKLTQNKYALVDDEDYDFLNQWKWHASKLSNKFYAIKTDYKNKRTIPIHRVIMNTPKGMETDHIDGNGLNNQKSNLRICTHQENMRNQEISKNNTSGYKGVSFITDEKCKTKKWRARLERNNKKIHLGCFETKKEAALAYNDAIIKYHKEFARLNFIK